MNNEIPTTPQHRQNPLPPDAATAGLGTVAAGAAADAVDLRDPLIDPARDEVGLQGPERSRRLDHRSVVLWIVAAVMVLIVLTVMLV